MKIIVTAGGTMGHINPAIAIIKEFLSREPDLEVIYIGTHNRMEKDVIPKLGYRYVPIKVYGFTKNIFKDFYNVFLLQEAKRKCEKLIDEEKPDVVIGVGGYVTYPVVLAAHKKNVPIFIHEQNSIPGKSNRMVSKYANLIGVSFASSEKYFSNSENIIYTGNPCGTLALDVCKKDKTTLGFSQNKKLITIVAGSLGSDSLNKKMIPFLESVQNKDYEICYITGKMHYEEMKKYELAKNVLLFPYIDELPGLLKASDVVISRAGAGSLSEIIALNIPSIIIPSPNVSYNHQYYNALELQEKNCVVMLEESTLSKEVLLESIDKLLNDTDYRLKILMALKKENTVKSTTIIYEKIKELIS